MKTKLILLAVFSMLIIACSENGKENILEESGTVESENVLISSERAGKIKELRFEEGDNVKIGDTLLIIDHELLTIKLNQIKAAEKIALANYQLAQKGARIEDKKNAAEHLKQAELNYNSAKKDYERFKNLLAEKVITQKQFDDAETRFKISETGLISASENLKKIENITRPEELLKAEAKYEQAQANSAEIQKLINDSFLLSPINGTVVKQYVEKGETVNPSSSLLKITDLSEIEITIYVSETNLGRVKLGQKAEIKSDTYENKTYKGVVKYISPEAEFTPKNVQTKDERIKLVFAIKITADNKDRELKSGMPVDVTLSLD